MKISRTLTAILLALSMAVFLGACTGTSSESSESDWKIVKSGDSKITLRFIGSWGGVDSKAETLKLVLSQFENRNPDVTVINESVFGEDFLPKIKTDFASGNDPDVFGLWPGSDIKKLIQVGKVADLTGLLEENPEWKEQFDPEMWSYTTYNGRIYGLPFEIIFECMFVNKDLFEQYNVKIPENFDELKEAVRIFNRNGIVPIAYNTEAEGTYFYQNLLPVVGGKADTENPFTRDGKIKQSHIVALNLIKELYDMGAFPKECFTMTNNERNVLFKEKKAAMIVQGSWYIGEFEPDDDTVDIIPFPSVKGYESYRNTMVYGLGGGVFHMSTAAWNDPRKREASVRLLRFLTSPLSASEFAAKTGMISTVSLGGYEIDYIDMTIKGLQMLEEANTLVGPLDSYVERTAWEKYIAGQFPYFLSGKISAEEMWETAIKNGIILNY